MTEESVIQLIKEAHEKNSIEFYLSWCQLTQMPQEVGELKNLETLYLPNNLLSQLPPTIGELKDLKTLYLSNNQLIQLQSEIGKLEKLEILNLRNNHLTKLPPEIVGLKNLKILDLAGNKLTQLPPEIGQLEKLEILNLQYNHLTKLPPEIAGLKNLKTLDLAGNQLTQLPPEIGQLEKLSKLYLNENQLTHLPKNIRYLKNLETLYLTKNQLIQLPSEIAELIKLETLYLTKNQLTKLPPEITELKNLCKFDSSENPLITPIPPEIHSKGLKAIFSYIKQSTTIENNEAKLILVGNGDVGKTCLAYRLINNDFLKDGSITNGINISKWEMPAPGSENSKIKLNIWDFGGQEIYHATHQFFMTKRSMYILVWNARKTKDYDHIYYWLHTIEAFGEDSPIILVMSKMNERNDDLNLKDLKSKFSQIADYLKIDNYDGTGIDNLTVIISKIAWNLPLMRVKWVDSWFRVRQKLEKLEENWIAYDRFYEICKSEGLDNETIDVLDDYLHDLGVTLHFKDRLTLKNIVILKPEWATGAFYKILSTKYVSDNEGVLPLSELSKIWDNKIYRTSTYPQLMDLMNKFELAYELPDEQSYLVPELLPKSMPSEFEWNEKGNLFFYYSYDNFMPPGIIPRFIVRMHQNIEKKKNGMPFCWREGTVLRFENSSALVMMKPDERQIEIRIKGENKRWALGAICSQLDQINASIKKINFSKQIPCNCSINCPQRHLYDDLLKAESAKLENLTCYKSFKQISVSKLLDGYSRRDERVSKYDEISKQLVQNIVVNSNHTASLETNSFTQIVQKTDVNVGININLKVDLPQIQNEFDKLKDELENINPKLDNDLEKIQDSLDEISTNSDQEKLAKPFNKLYRLLDKLSDPNSDYNKVITGTQKGIELAQKVGRTYNKFAQWLAMPQVPDLFLGK